MARPKMESESRNTAERSPQRTASIERNTSETQLKVSVNVDGTGHFEGALGVPFFEHMLNLLARHALIDLTIQGCGDIEIDAHHLVEDTGIVLGCALREALGSKQGIERYGAAAVPMEETLARCVLDICNRPFFRYSVDMPKAKVGSFDAELGEEFLRAFVFNAGITMHVSVEYGSNVHHILEAVFKSVGLALGKAAAYNPRIRGVFSTKGSL